ncbi:hypothetical protein EV426DRAFT_365178 [Tirmania nivea]|nr:hypothetical protein EV426DRAFT_365178 [Tirmania nivea]
MRSLLGSIAIACLLPIVSGTFFIGENGKHASHGAEAWRALVNSGLANVPKEAHVGKRAESTAPPSTTARPTATTTTATGPSPWVSLDAEGSPVTVTPVVTTDAQGSPSTADLAPTSTSALTDTDKNDQTHRVEIQCSESSYQDRGKWAPFCLPHNGSEWRVDEKGGAGFYYVTWNPDVFARNETVHMSLNFVNQTDEKSAAGIWVKTVEANVGWVDVTPLSKWLEDAPHKDSVDVYFLMKGSRSNSYYTGPTITVTTKPKPPKVDTSPNNRPPVNTLGLAIGIPVVVLFIIVMVLGTHFCMRERRKVGPIHIGGVRGRKEYGTRMSRRQRMKGAGVPLAQGEGYTDERDEHEHEHGVPPVARNSPGGGGGWELTDVQGGRAQGYDDNAREYGVEGRGRI